MQLISLAASVILEYYPKTVLSKLYNIIALELFFIFNKASKPSAEYLIFYRFKALFLILSKVSTLKFLSLFRLVINLRRSEV